MQQEIKIPQGAFVGPNKQPIYGWKTVRAECVAGLAVARNDTPKARFAWMVYHVETVKALKQSPGMMQILNIIHEKTLDAM